MDGEIGNIKYDEEFILNSRGVRLFTCSWIPQNEEPKALIFICHGYAMECSITMNSTAVRLANAGFACYGIDYEGHGKSAGLNGYINNFHNLIGDCCSHFTNICEKKQNKEKMRFLLGESMGGAMVLLVQRKKPDYFDGAVLVAPMCKIADNMKPHPLVLAVLTKLCNFIPTWKIIPGEDIIDVAFKETEKRKEIRANPYCYKGRPRLRTAYELLKVSLDLEHRLEEVSIPFLVLHGEADRVTDKDVSRQLYELASSLDKTIKLYPEMWHGLLYGEPPKNTEIVFTDIVSWLNDRAVMVNSRIERELKHLNDDLISSK